MEEGKESETGGTRQRLTRISYPLPCPSRLPCGNGMAPRGEPEAEGQEGERPGAAGMEDPESGPLFRALRPRRRRAVTIPHNPGRPRARHGSLSHVGPGFVRPDQLWPFPAGGRGAPLAAGVQGSRRRRRRSRRPRMPTGPRRRRCPRPRAHRWEKQTHIALLHPLVCVCFSPFYSRK